MAHKSVHGISVNRSEPAERNNRKYQIKGKILVIIVLQWRTRSGEKIVFSEENEKTAQSKKSV